MAHRNGDGVQAHSNPQGDPYDDKYRVKTEKPRDDDYEEENADGYEEEFVDFNEDDLALEGGIRAVYRGNYQAEEVISSKLLFFIQELGCMKKQNDGSDIYAPGKTCESAAKDIAKLCKCDNPNDPAAKYLLGKWVTIRKDLLPLFMSQTKNKKLIYNVLTIMTYLTSSNEDVKDNPKKLNDLNGFLEDYKELFSIPEFADTLIKVLGDIVKAEEKTKNHYNMMELIVTLIRNILQIQVHSKNVVETYKESIQAILFINFSKGGGIFDAIIYLCQNMSTEINKRLRLVYLDIFYSIFSSIPGTFLFGSGSEGEYFKILRDKQKLDRLKRFSQLSTRHSRFGAMIQVKRSVGQTSGIVSSVVFKPEDINKNQNQKIKPKPNKRFAAARDTQIYGRMIVDENAASWNEDERKLQTALTHFVLDFLENANEPLIESIFDLVRRENSGLIEKDFIHFFVMMSFGIECYCNEFEKTIAKQGIDAHYNRMAIEEKMNCKFSFIVHSIQITLIDVLYKKLVEEITKKKTEFQTKSYHAAINYFLQILNATLILSRSTYQNDAKNAQLLMQIIFSKEFSKIIKIGFLFYEPKIQYGRYVDTLVRVQDAFFTLLSVYAKNKTISLQTDKRVKKAHKNFQKKVKTEVEGEQGEEADSRELSQVEEDFEEEDDDRDDYVIKERKYNYYSEFSNFVDYQTIQKMLNLIRGEKMVWNHKRINQGVYNYIYRIVNDLAGEWIFFQMDFLSCFNEILQNEMIIFKKEHSQFVELIRKIVKSFFRHLQKNALLSVESIFRFSDLATKDRILNNYDFLQSIRQIEENEPVINKTVIPWSKEEDLILIENFEFYKTDKDPWLSLSNLLRDQAFFRDKKEVKFRVKLIKLDKSKDTALQLIEGAYTKKFSLEEVVVRMLLYSHSNGRSTELHFINYLKEIREEYRLYKKMFSMTEVPMAVVPTNQQHFELLEYSFVPSVFEFFNFEKPRYGCIYWRVPNKISADMLDQVIEAFVTLYECIRDKTETELLDMGDQEYQVHNIKARRVSEKKAKKRSSKAEERRQKREDAFRDNQELAELMDSDEELSLASDDSSDHLDYEVVPIRRKNVEVQNENFEEDRGQDSDKKMDLELENGVKKHRRLKKNTGAEMDEDE